MCKVLRITSGVALGLLTSVLLCVVGACPFLSFWCAVLKSRRQAMDGDPFPLMDERERGRITSWRVDALYRDVFLTERCSGGGGGAGGGFFAPVTLGGIALGEGLKWGNNNLSFPHLIGCVGNSWKNFQVRCKGITTREAEKLSGAPRSTIKVKLAELVKPRVNNRLQLAFEGFIENGGEHRVKLGGDM